MPTNFQAAHSYRWGDNALYYSDEGNIPFNLKPSQN
jgi:hypothetical protein